MALTKLGYVDLPQHRATGCFDHADVHAPTDCLYVAHEIGRAQKTERDA